MSSTKRIGVFDSGVGGLSVLKKIKDLLPQYDYVYLGDCARTPYGSRSFDVVHDFTLQAVRKLFSLDCSLVILACNTASAKALRNIQQLDLPKISPDHRVLGVIRPLTESIIDYTTTKKIGVFATEGTVRSRSYPIEINKFFNDIEVFQEACPMWVPLIENEEFNSDGADYFVRKHVDNLLLQCPSIDAIILGCTHYPIMIDKIRKHLPKEIELIVQGDIVAHKLSRYLDQHKKMESMLSKNGDISFYTTDDSNKFNRQASLYLEDQIYSKHIELG